VKNKTIKNIINAIFWTVINLLYFIFVILLSILLSPIIILMWLLNDESFIKTYILWFEGTFGELNNEKRNNG